MLLLASATAACATLLAPTVQTLRDHPGFVWHAERSAHFHFYFERGTFADNHVATLEQRAEDARGRVLTLLGERDAEDVSVFVVQSRARMKALIGREVNGQAIPQSRVALYVVNDSIDASGAHELCHVIAKGSWGDADNWINEGLAVYADDRWEQRSLHAVASYFVEQKQFVPLRELLSHFGKYSEGVAYPEAGSFVKFLYESYGRDAVKQVWKGGLAAIPRVTGKSVDALACEWQSRIMPRAQPNVRCS